MQCVLSLENNLGSDDKLSQYIGPIIKTQSLGLKKCILT